MNSVVRPRGSAIKRLPGSVVLDRSPSCHGSIRPRHTDATPARIAPRIGRGNARSARLSDRPAIAGDAPRLGEPDGGELGGRQARFRGVCARTCSSFAGWLVREAGVEPGDRIAICLPKSLEMVRATLWRARRGCRLCRPPVPRPAGAARRHPRVDRAAPAADHAGDEPAARSRRRHRRAAAGAADRSRRKAETGSIRLLRLGDAARRHRRRRAATISPRSSSPRARPASPRA